MSTDDKKLASAETALSFTRIRTIMKSSVDTGNITNEVLFLMTKSTELFIQQLTKDAYAKPDAKKKNLLRYVDLAQHVFEEPRYEFLLQIIPKKIKVKEFKKILQNIGDDDDDTSDDSSSESEKDT